MIVCDCYRPFKRVYRLKCAEERLGQSHLHQIALEVVDIDRAFVHHLEKTGEVGLALLQLRGIIRIVARARANVPNSGAYTYWGR